MLRRLLVQVRMARRLPALTRRRATPMLTSVRCANSGEQPEIKGPFAEQSQRRARTVFPWLHTPTRRVRDSVHLLGVSLVVEAVTYYVRCRIVVAQASDLRIVCQ